jgi:hypothetical protein
VRHYRAATALVLMAHLRFPRISASGCDVIHCSEQHGGRCKSVLALRQTG